MAVIMNTIYPVTETCEEITKYPLLSGINPSGRYTGLSQLLNA